jgi:hypothetical protein
MAKAEFARARPFFVPTHRQLKVYLWKRVYSLLEVFLGDCVKNS